MVHSDWVKGVAVSSSLRQKTVLEDILLVKKFTFCLYLKNIYYA